MHHIFEHWLWLLSSVCIHNKLCHLSVEVCSVERLTSLDNTKQRQQNNGHIEPGSAARYKCSLSRLLLLVAHVNTKSSHIIVVILRTSRFLLSLRATVVWPCFFQHLCMSKNQCSDRWFYSAPSLTIVPSLSLFRKSFLLLELWSLLFQIVMQALRFLLLSSFIFQVNNSKNRVVVVRGGDVGPVSGPPSEAVV